MPSAGTATTPTAGDSWDAAESWIGKNIAVEGLEGGITIAAEIAHRVASHYLFAVKSAGDLYRHIAEQRAGKALIIEVSMDETATPQTPEEIFLILLALSLEGVPLQTFAPRFSGRFNKGVQYVGDPAAFAEGVRKRLPDPPARRGGAGPSG
jgi:hypothetical protein